MDNEKEEKAFHELKKRMEGDMEKEMFEDDNIFYRFLKARNLDVDLAEDMLRKHLEWRIQRDVKNISEFKSPEVLEKYLPCNFIGHTKEGEVLRYMPGGSLDMRGIFASCPAELIEKHLVKVYEEDLEALRKQSEKIGKRVDKVIYINNLKGLTLAKLLDKKVLRHSDQMNKMYQDNYPESLKTIYAFNAPSYIGLIYTILKSFLPKQLMEKIKLYTDDSWKEDILKIADAEILPAFLGGTRTDPDGNPLCNTFINHGGTVPESYYIKKDEYFANLPDTLKITVPRAAVHQIPLEVELKDTFVEWEFNVKSGDIKFGMKYQNGDEAESEVIPLQRVTTNEKNETGCCKCENIGTYIIVFDNSYSYLRSKDIFYKIQVISPENEVRCLEE